MKMKKCVLVCLFLIFLFPTSNALSSDFYWAFLFSDHGKDINGTTDYRMVITAGIDSYPPNGVTLDFPDKGTQIRLDPWSPHVWDPTYYEYGRIIYDPPPGDWYKTSYQFLVDDGTSSPLFSHATNNIFPMDFVEADISGRIHPTITWEPVEFADRYQIRFFDTVTGERLFEESIDEDGSNSYSYQYLGNLFEEHEKLRIRISARDYDNDQIVNRSHVSYEHSPEDPPVIDSIDYDGCISELCTTTLVATAHDPAGGTLTYEWDLNDDGSVDGTGDSYVFDPPAPSASPACDPYFIKLTVTSDASGLSVEEIVGITVKLAGDVTGDGWVNLSDLNEIRDHFMQHGAAGWIDADLNCDGWVNLLDLNLVRDHFMSLDGCACQP